MLRTLQLLPPMRFRFTDPDDIAAYGDRWWVWDEVAVTRLRGRELIAIEDTLDLAIPVLIRLLHTSESTLAHMAAMWIAVHRDGHPVAWADFNPIALAAEWEEVPAPPLESGEAPAPDSGSSPAPSTESVSS